MAESTEGTRKWVINASDSEPGALKVGSRLRLTAFPAFDRSDDYKQEPFLIGEATVVAIHPNGPRQSTVEISDITWTEVLKDESD